MALSSLTNQNLTQDFLSLGIGDEILVAQSENVDAAIGEEAQQSEQENTIIVEKNESGELSVSPSSHGEATGTSVGTSSHDLEESIFPPFDTSTYGAQLFWLAFSFGALYLLMSKVALPRIGEILEVRRDRIEGDLAEAERLRQKTDQAIQTYETELAEARAKSHAIAEETRNDVKKQLDEKRRDVEADLAKQVASAEQRILKTKTQALTNVEQIAAETAVALVGKLTSKISIKDARSAVSAVVKG